MKNYAKLIKLTLLVVSSTLMFSCSDDDSPTQNNSITDIASGNPNFSILVDALTRANLAKTLDQEGSHTVFAPTNAAFDKLPKGTVETLVKPENLKMLQTILTYHVVAGKMNAADIAKAIQLGNGKAMLKTVSGGTLTAWMEGSALYLSDENGTKSKVTIADVNQSNGVIHVVDTVVLPKK